MNNCAYLNSKPQAVRLKLWSLSWLSTAACFRRP